MHRCRAPCGVRATSGSCWATFMFSAWCVRVPLAAFMAIPLGLSVPFVWLAAVAENWVRAGLTTWRFRSGKWKHMKV